MQNPWGHTWDGSWTQMAPRSGKISATPPTCRSGYQDVKQLHEHYMHYTYSKDGELWMLKFWTHQFIVSFKLMIWIHTIVIFKKDMMVFQYGPSNAWTSSTSHPDCCWADGVWHSMKPTGMFSHVCFVNGLWNAVPKSIATSTDIHTETCILMYILYIYIYIVYYIYNIYTYIYKYTVYIQCMYIYICMYVCMYACMYVM